MGCPFSRDTFYTITNRGGVAKRGCYELPSTSSRLFGTMGVGQIVFVTEVQSAGRYYWGAVSMQDVTRVLADSPGVDGATQCWFRLSTKWKEQYVNASSGNEVMPLAVCLKKSEAVLMNEAAAREQQIQRLLHDPERLRLMSKAGKYLLAILAVVGLGALLCISFSKTDGPRRAPSDPILRSTWLQREASLAALRQELETAQRHIAELVGRGADGDALRDLQTQMQTIEDSQTCPICCESKLSHCLVPCGHCFCDGCARRAVSRRRCHTCRRSMVSMQRLYLP